MQIEKLTPDMERVLRLAEVEASKSDEFVGVNHVLIGMMLEGDNYASLALADAGFTVDGLRKVETPVVAKRKKKK